MFFDVKPYSVLKKSIIFEPKKANRMSENRRLKRNMTNKVLGGVCSGLADYFDVDVTLIRAVVASSIIFAGVGLGLYLVLWLLVPTE